MKITIKDEKIVSIHDLRMIALCHGVLDRETELSAADLSGMIDPKWLAENVRENESDTELVSRMGGMLTRCGHWYEMK